MTTAILSALPEEQQGQHDRGERRGARLHLPEMPGERPQLGEDVIAADRHSDQLADLPDDHRDGHPGQVSDQDRLGQQVGDEPQLENSGENGDRADHQRQDGCVGNRETRVAIGRDQWNDAGGDHRAK